MVTSWRTKWNQGDFPFYFAQIAPFNYGKNNAAFLREAQLKSSQSLQNCRDGSYVRCWRLHPNPSIQKKGSWQASVIRSTS